MGSHEGRIDHRENQRRGPNPLSSLRPHEVYRARENEIGHCAFIVFV